jgi:hypothetical protein
MPAGAPPRKTIEEGVPEDAKVYEKTPFSDVVVIPVIAPEYHTPVADGAMQTQGLGHARDPGSYLLANP